MKYTFLFTFLVLILSCGVLAQTVQTVPPVQQTPVDVSLVKGGGYLLGPGDEITAKVLGEGQFDFVAVIDEDGRIEVPYHDKPLLAKCKTERQLRAELTQLLTRDLRDPRLSLRTISNSRPPAVIYGEVRSPQKVVLMRKATLIEMLALAGGVEEEAGGMVQVFRTQAPMCPGDATADEWAVTTDAAGIPYRMYSLASVRQGLQEANPMILPGDVIVVQRARPIYVIGEVLAPQGIYLKEGGLTLQEALAKIGGLTRTAKTKDIKIYRLKANSKDREVIAVNYDLIKSGKQKDIVLEPEDVVEVGRSRESIAKQILGFAVGASKTLVTSGASGVGSRVLY